MDMLRRLINYRISIIIIIIIIVVIVVVVKDEASKTLIPVKTPSDDALAPPYIREMIRCV